MCGFIEPLANTSTEAVCICYERAVVCNMLHQTGLLCFLILGILLQ